MTFKLSAKTLILIQFRKRETNGMVVWTNNIDVNSMRQRLYALMIYCRFKFYPKLDERNAPKIYRLVRNFSKFLTFRKGRGIRGIYLRNMSLYIYVRNICSCIMVSFYTKFSCLEHKCKQTYI